jgi:ankyrin repeat protein
MCSNDGRSPVFNAAQNGHNVIVAQLVSARGDVNKCNKNGASPLYVASQNGHGAIISTLVLARGDVTKCRNDGTSPIYVAAQNGHSDIIAQLVSAGGNVNTCDNEGASPIFVAAQKSSKGHAACILQLLESGADPRSSYKGTSALDMARQQGHPESVRVLEAALNFAIK